ncbi:GntR family transcriptional regulator [Vibrio mediterranei]|uniref:GntR family transcriptional regulator n=1 Tax=Vibrio mediterranei TaxID=689 RepID=UPI001EFD0AAC|nr:GntR family transcriptional regulator [Vibrio mediterranei]MCG9626172.1 GntR family transcriptional regulator [Vibrio mediterranei]
MNEGVPLYITIKNTIEERIFGAIYQDRIEGELILAKEFGVARGTIKQAIDELVSDGLLIKKRGLGTFINEERLASKALDFPDFLSQSVYGDDLRCKILNILPVNATPEIAELMEITIGAPLFKVEREYSASGKKIAYSESYFDANTFPDISSLYFNTPLYAQLRTNYGKAPTRLSEHYSFDIATETECILLEIEQSPTVIAKICRRSFDITNAVIDYTEILCHKRTFELTTDIKSIHTSEVGHYQSNIKFK